MKTLFALAILIIIYFYSGCSSWEEANRQNTKEDSLASIENYIFNPCKDSLYLSLKKKNIDSLTSREYEYFLAKEKECAEFNKTQMTTDPQKRIAKQYETNSGVWIFRSCGWCNCSNTYTFNEPEMRAEQEF